MNTWKINSFLPDSEPDLNNLQNYLTHDLISGASPDAQFIFDAIYSIERQSFVLTLMQVDNELGHIENEALRYPNTRQELLHQIELFQENPFIFWLNDANQS